MCLVYVVILGENAKIDKILDQYEIKEIDGKCELTVQELINKFNHETPDLDKFVNDQVDNFVELFSKPGKSSYFYLHLLS